MGLREWANNNAMMATMVAAGVLVVALGVVLMQARGARVPGGTTPVSAYFWDLDADRPFDAAADDRPPIDAPSGGQGARAHLFTCGQCAAGEWFGYLETYTDAGVAALEELPHVDDPLGGSELRELQETVRRNHVVRGLDDDRWVMFDSSAGMQVQDMRHRCDGGRELRRCQPGDP